MFNKRITMRNNVIRLFENLRLLANIYRLRISESDNLGSTDSEVKKILTLHLPISEYDTLGSDSDGDGRAASQELMSFGHRMRGMATVLGW